MTILLIISCIWLWVMLGLRVCQGQVNRWDTLRLTGLIFTILFAPIVAVAWISFLISEGERNPIIWRKK